ncbi:MAG: efflux RND transporter periplasmic adaptor subunit [Planctomycetes bacterium]|nr:efflux RND transporter periplasmic adaptor subunit [Planctomycetota bacterium]
MRLDRRTLLILTALTASACPGPKAAPGSAPAAADGPRAVQTAVATEEPWEKVLRLPGEMFAFEEATLSTKVAGRLEALEVDLGARVRKGQRLARIDPRDAELRAAQAEAAVRAARARVGLDGLGERDDVEIEKTPLVLAARAELEEATREHQRLKGLLRDGVVSPAAFDSAQARLVTAESSLQNALEEIRNRIAVLLQRRAELALARQQVADGEITAPFDGAVAARLAGTGDYLSSGASVARLVRFDPVRLRIGVPERYAAAVRIGALVRARLEGSERTVEGAVVRTSPVLDARNRTLQIEAEIPNADGSLRPGSFVKASIVLDAAAKALTIPADALVRFAGIDRVVAVEGGKALEKRVTVGRIEGSRCEILDGLRPGDDVIRTPGNLRTGDPVTLTR